MSEELSQNDTVPRIRLGEAAIGIARKVAGDEQITKAHLEEAITRLQSAAATGSDQPITANPDWLKDQLVMINEGLATLSYMLLALVAETDEEIQISLGKLHERMIVHLAKNAEEKGLDDKKLDAVLERLEATHMLYQQMNQVDQQHHMGEELEP